MIHKWKFLNRQVIFEHPRLTIVEDSVLLPNKEQISYLREKPSAKDSVAVIAINKRGEVLLQKEYSYPPNKVMYQLPGGSIESHEDIIAAANRELSEESGFTGDSCEIIGSFYLNNRRSNRKQHVVVCKNLKVMKQKSDKEEFIESAWFKLDNLKKLISDGGIENVSLLAALSLLDNR